MNRRHVLREVEGKLGLGIGCVLGTGLLSASFLGIELADEFLVGSLACLAAGFWFLARGARELTVDANTITVTRRGRVRFRRLLSAVRTTNSWLVNVHWVTFVDGERLFWICGSTQWQSIADLLLVGDSREASWAHRGRWSRLDCPVSSLVFPEDTCVGCERPPVREASLSASRGLSLILFDAVAERDLPVPCCKTCHRRRSVLAALKWLPGCLLLGFLFAQISLKIPSPAAYWLAGTLLCLQLALMNFGDRLWDRVAFGVHVRRLTPSLARVSLVFRDPERGLRVAQLSGALGETVAVHEH